MAIDPNQVQAAVLAANSAMKGLIVAAGSDCAFKLRTSREFTIKGVLKHVSEQAMTDGLSQDNRRLTVSAELWDAEAPVGRMPEKGDQVTIVGRRYAIMEADPVVMSGVKMVYRIKLKG